VLVGRKSKKFLQQLELVFTTYCASLIVGLEKNVTILGSATAVQVNVPSFEY